MNRIIECRLDSTYKEIYTGIWQHDYGQILRITGADLPKAVEVQFSLRDKGGDTLTRIGTTVDGATEVKVPDSFLKNENCTQNYLIYAWIYVTDDASGNTEYQIILHVKSRPKPEEPTEEPLPEPNIFHETVEAVNAAADRAEQAGQNAKASATEAGKYAAGASESATAAEKTKEDALREIGEKKQKAIEAIQEQEETSVGKIVNHTNNEIKRILNQTAESKGELEQTITNAGVSKEELDESIQTAGDTKTALDKSTELAGAAKTELDTSTQKAGEAKTALDGSTNTAGEMQETLNATVKQAGALDTSLSEKIDIGNKAPAIIKKASGKTIIINDSSNLPIKILSGTGKIIITGKNILNENIRSQFVPFEAKAGTTFTLITNGELSAGGNIKFIGEKDEDVWFAIDEGETKVSQAISANVKGYTNLLMFKEGLKYCFSVGENDEYEEHVEQVITAPVDSEQLKAIHTNYPTTVLTSENEISVEYVADTEAYIEKRIKEENQSLQKQILEIKKRFN